MNYHLKRLTYIMGHELISRYYDLKTSVEERANSVFLCFEKNASKVWSFETAVYLFKCLSNLEIFILLYSYSFTDA